MKRAVYTGLGLTILCLSVPTSTFADVQLFSQAGQALTTIVGNDGVVLGSPVSGTSVAITPDSLWAFPTNGGPNGAQWISNSASGFGDTDFQNFNTTNAIFELDVSFSVTSASTLALDVWSDDTATVRLSGPAPTLISYAPNGAPNLPDLSNGVLATAITGMNSTCSGAVIGCLAVNGLTGQYSLVAGNYTLKFLPYQIGTGQDNKSNPFGLLYSATVTTNGTTTFSTPEAGTLLLLAFMFSLMLAAVKLRRLQA